MPSWHMPPRVARCCVYMCWSHSLWVQPDSALQHYQFLRESLRDLAQQLLVYGARLQLAVGEVPEVLAQLHALQPSARLVSLEETGNGAIYARDLAVARWCRWLGVAAARGDAAPALA